jgi:hypothetical protein
MRGGRAIDDAIRVLQICPALVGRAKGGTRTERSGTRASGFLQRPAHSTRFARPRGGAYATKGSLIPPHPSPRIPWAAAGRLPAVCLNAWQSTTPPAGARSGKEADCSRSSRSRGDMGVLNLPRGQRQVALANRPPDGKLVPVGVRMGRPAASPDRRSRGWSGGSRTVWGPFGRRTRAGQTAAGPAPRRCRPPDEARRPARPATGVRERRAGLACRRRSAALRRLLRPALP